MNEMTNETKLKAEFRSVIGNLVFDGTVSTDVCIARAELLKKEIDYTVQALRRSRNERDICSDTGKPNNECH